MTTTNTLRHALLLVEHDGLSAAILDHSLSGKSSIAVAAMPTLVPNLSIVPANSDLVGLESEMMVEANRPFRLRDAVE